jgi:hypothetical protein
MRRSLLTTGTLGLLASLAILLFSAGGAAARTATGQFTVKNGQTIHFTHVNIDSSDIDYVGFDAFTSGGDYVYGDSIGDNSLSIGTNYVLTTSPSWTNTTGNTLYVRLYLDDWSSGGWPAEYWSDGGSNTDNSAGWVDHATAGYVKGKAVVSINDANFTGSTVKTNDPWSPTLGAGNFNATVTVRGR